MVAQRLARGCSVVMVSLAASLVAASCGGPAAPPGATVPDSVLGQPPPSPYAVPQVITKPYVQSVLNALEAVESQATVSIVSHKAFTPAAAALIHSVTTPNEYKVQHQTWLLNLSAASSSLPAHPSPVLDSVQQVFPSSPDCIFVSTIRHVGNAVIGPNLPDLTYIVLNTGTVSSPNPTPWLIDQLGYNAKGAVPKDTCSP
ncbi:MAG: hypothetical protein ACRDX8_14755 [Acidimicrobiales bacterium]